MHIPDGYLGPQTYVPLLAVMTGIWSAALARLKRTLRLRQVPLLAMGAAFSFVIMMFNIPIPGGTTGHAVGSVLIAILLGPWAAMVAVSLTLIIQALMFGDGGITAIGANCFTMAVVMPVTGWGMYRSLLGSGTPSHRRTILAAAAAGYVGLVAAAIVAGVLFGLQPVLAHDAAGQPLYCPFGLDLAVPAMALEHLMVFGVVEAAATALTLAYLYRTAPDMLRLADSATSTAAPSIPGAVANRGFAWMAAGLGALILLAPLGLYLPEKFGAGSAWGEWSSDEIKTEMAKAGPGKETHAPAGIVKAEAAGWKAPMPDYALPGNQTKPSLFNASMIYILSALVGVALLTAIIWPLRKLLRA